MLTRYELYFVSHQTSLSDPILFRLSSLPLHLTMGTRGSTLHYTAWVVTANRSRRSRR